MSADPCFASLISKTRRCWGSLQRRREKIRSALFTRFLYIKYQLNAHPFSHKNTHFTTISVFYKSFSEVFTKINHQKSCLLYSYLYLSQSKAQLTALDNNKLFQKYHTTEVNIEPGVPPTSIINKCYNLQHANSNI